MSVSGDEKIHSPEQMFGLFCAEVMTQLPNWRSRLLEAPDSLEALEREVQTHFAHGSGMLVAGILAVVLGSEELSQSSEQTRRGFAYPLARGRQRRIKVQLLGGFIMWIASLYCEPKKGVFRRSVDSLSGLYIELAQFGFGKSISPALESKVSRQVASHCSINLAREELLREGMTLNAKAIRRIAYDCGENLLKLRKAQLMRWRKNQLPAGQEFKGLRIAVQIDGGRAKIRSALRMAINQKESRNSEGLFEQDAPGRSHKPSQRTFDADWREPKLVTIFAHDENGKMVKEHSATIDGTFAGPDAIAELIAMHLQRLGAGEAQSITFVADGATWIWDRIDAIVAKAKITEPVKIYQVLDNCHAVHHISLALAAFGYSDEERKPLYREYRTKLRNGHWRQVIDELQDVATDRGTTAADTEIEYIRKHGQAGRLSYRHFKAAGLPLGSGAIESSIRRVINLRMKSNGMFWLKENAEIMLQLRANVISGRWDERMVEVRNMKRTQYEPTWEWVPQKMSCKSEPEIETSD